MINIGTKKSSERKNKHDIAIILIKADYSVGAVKKDDSQPGRKTFFNN